MHKRRVTCSRNYGPNEWIQVLLFLKNKACGYIKKESADNKIGGSVK